MMLSPPDWEYQIEAMQAKLVEAEMLGTDSELWTRHGLGCPVCSASLAGSRCVDYSVPVVCYEVVTWVPGHPVLTAATRVGHARCYVRHQARPRGKTTMTALRVVMVSCADCSWVGCVSRASGIPVIFEVISFMPAVAPLYERS